MDTALYLRVSTGDQKLHSQEVELKNYCERRGWTHLRLYTDQISGAKTARVGLDRLMTDARSGKIARIVV